MTYPYKYILNVFASSGDVTPVPDAIQPDGTVSYAQGFGPDYQLDPATNPNALDIDRGNWNGIQKDVTGAVQYWEQNTVAYWIDNATNGGVAFSYALGAIVKYTDNIIYQSIAAANTTVPGTDPTKWQVLGISPVHQVINGGTSTGSAGVQACACSPVVGALAAGMLVNWTAGFTCTGAGTLTLDATAAKSIKKWSSGALADPSAGDFTVGQECQALYDGTYFILNMPLPQTVSTVNQVIQGGTSGGTAGAQTLTCSPTVAALATGDFVVWAAGFTCTGAGTLKLDGTAAKNLKKYANGALVDPAAGDFVTGQICVAVYDGTQFVLSMPLAPGYQQPIPFAAGWTSAGTALSIVASQIYGYVIIPFACTYEGETGYAETAPTGSICDFDILKNGTTIYSTKPKFADGANTLTAGVVSGTVTFAAGDRVQFKNGGSVGSTSAAARVGFTLKLRQS